MHSLTIETQWHELESEAAGAGGWRLRLARPVKGHPLYAAIDGMRRVLLLRVPIASIPPRHRWPTCKGLEMLAITVAGHAHLGVALREPRFFDVFAALAEDLANRVGVAGDKPERAVAVLFGQLARWQRFLAATAVGLSKEAQRGLWGELHVLHNILIPCLDEEAIGGWKGPDGSHQDFQYERAWMEVKTTLAKQPQNVHITSERQLDDTHAPILFLHVNALETRPDGATSLPALVALLRNVINKWPVAREKFEDALLASRYLDLHAPHYAATGYVVRRSDTFRIGPKFPRIIEAQLPLGVGDASYRLSIAACTDFLVPSSVIELSLAGSPSAD